jgi:hypothetical protein
MPDLKYPIGEFTFDSGVAREKRAVLIEELAESAERLRVLLSKLTIGQLDLSYREGGWTVRQLVHHLADSSVNWYMRFKVALTEPNPEIKPFDGDAWSALPDALTLDPDLSVNILAAIHTRMVAVMHTMQPEAFSRTLRHPERGTLSIDYVLQCVHWHMRHHTAHIASIGSDGK